MRSSRANFSFAAGSLLCLACGLSAGLAGCKHNTAQTAAQTAVTPGTDPALANLAPVAGTQASPAGQPGAVLGQRAEYQGQASGQSYPQNESLNYNTQPPPGSAQDSQSYNQGYDQNAVDAGEDALDEQAVYADQAPPPLPVYQQPELTEDNYEWTPGYWDYGPSGYFWVPGAWVAPPYVGALWTPGYWAADSRRYRFHHGFWARHIGFYGGIPYGFGYVGFGYEGGYWNGGAYYYNRAVNRINIGDVHHVYAHDVRVFDNSRASFNGPGGWNVRPRPAELAVLHEQRLAPMQTQRQFVQQAASNREQFYAANHGRPAVIVASQRLTADRNIPQPAPRGGFGPPQGRAPNQPLQRPQQQQQEQQRAQQQQHQFQQQQIQQQQHNAAGQQQREQQQHNAAGQQQRQQQHNAAEQQQREQQQHNAAEQQQRQQQQHNAAEQQRNRQQPEHERQTSPAPRLEPGQPAPEIHNHPVMAPRQEVQPRPDVRPQPQPRSQEQARPQPPPRQEAPRPQPQSHPEPQHQAPAPHAEPHPQPHQGQHQNHAEDHPHGGH